ncbi:MAG: hypothetical protein IJ156_09535 [Bacteroidales bacterium]|nr:hypothetical protein [Bacteroidales bacterium]
MSRERRLRLRGREGLLLAASLLIALAVWFLSNLSQNYSGVVTVPVVAECNIPGHSNLSAGSALVSARCRTTGFRLLREGSRSRSRQVRVSFERADMHHLDGDRFFVAGSAKNTYSEQFFGDEVQVESFVTDTLFFRFPAENHKKVPVQLSGDISYRDQYMASGPLRLVPDSVTVYGEQARLDMVDHVVTAPLLLDDVHQSQQGTLRLRRIKGVRLSDEIVSYDLPVSRYVELRSSLPVTVEGLPAGRHLQVYPSQAEVVLHCAFPVGRDPFGAITLTIDYKDFVSSISGRCIPRVRQLPAGVLDYRVVPEIFDCIETD